MKNLKKQSFFRKIFPILLFLIFSILQFYFLRDKTQSWYFQDETEHITLGWMMLKFGKHLYRDLSTNHQPLPILLGYIINLVFPSEILFGFIERIRLVIFAWHFACGIYLVLRFKERGLLTVIFYQSLNYLFLATTPWQKALWLHCSLFFLIFFGRKHSGKKYLINLII